MLQPGKAVVSKIDDPLLNTASQLRRQTASSTLKQLTNCCLTVVSLSVPDSITSAPSDDFDHSANIKTFWLQITDS